MVSSNIDSYSSDKTLSFLLASYCALLPFEEALAGIFGSVLKIAGIAVIAYALVALVRQRVAIGSIGCLVPFYIWFFVCLVSYFWCADETYYLYFLSIYGFQLVFISVIVLSQKIIDTRCFLRGLIIAGVVASALIVFFSNTETYTDEGRKTIILFNRALDPNIVASILMLSIMSCMVFIFEYKRTEKRYIAFALFILFGMLSTGSRGALISFVVSFALGLFLEFKTPENKKKAVALLILAIVAALLMQLLLPENLLETRFSTKTILGLNEYYNGSHSRYRIWQSAAILIPRSPLLGFGCGSFMDTLATIYRHAASHNVYVLVTVEEGIVGLLPFLAGLIYLLLNLIKRHKPVYVAMLFSVCFMGLTLDSITYKYFWIAIALSALVIEADKSKLGGVSTK